MQQKKKPQKIHHRSKRLHLARHHHSGRRLPHGMTSYPALVVMVLVLGAVMLTAAVSARAATVIESGNITVGAIVPGAPPVTSAVIDNPTNGQRFTTTPIEVSGSCGANLLVKIFKNNLLAGSTYCSNLGRFSLNIDLLLGRNDLTAKNYDSLDQSGPDSPVVTVYYEPAPVGGGRSAPTTPGKPKLEPGVTPNIPSQQLVFQTDYRFKGLKPNVSFSWDLIISGGDAPYAVSIDWGDGQTTVLPAAQAGTIRPEHTYAQPGRYKIMIRGTDVTGHTAYLELAAVVDGVVPTLVGPIDTSSSEGQFYARAVALLPVYMALVALLVSFWLGEKYALSFTKRGRPIQKA